MMARPGESVITIDCMGDNLIWGPTFAKLKCEGIGKYTLYFQIAFWIERLFFEAIWKPLHNLNKTKDLPVSLPSLVPLCGNSQGCVLFCPLYQHLVEWTKDQQTEKR